MSKYAGNGFYSQLLWIERCLTLKSKESKRKVDLEMFLSSGSN